MTTLRPESDRLEERRTSRAGGSRRLTLTVVLVATVVVAGAGALIGWVVTASHLRADVSAGWASPLQCANTSVHERFGGDGVGRTPVVTLTRGLRCTVRFRLVNHGWRGVRIDTVTLPLMGRGTGGSMRVYGPHLEEDVGGPDAVFGVNRTLPSHSSLVVSYQLRFWGGGCMDRGSSMVDSGVPELRVSALGLSGGDHGSASLGEAGTEASGHGPGCR